MFNDCLKNPNDEKVPYLKKIYFKIRCFIIFFTNAKGFI